MFPSNLHRNIVQLDRQISLLEKECESMEAETRRKSTKSEQMHCKSSRNSNAEMKSPKVRVPLKKKSTLKRNKISPPHSGRIQSCSSIQSQCSKSLNDSSGTFVGRKTKSCGGNSYLQGCACQSLNRTQCNIKKEHKKGSVCNEKALQDLTEVERVCNDKAGHVLHREVLIPNPGSTIEVTVTQKSKSKENLPVVKTINVVNAPEKSVESCKCQGKGPKWSEILYLESTKIEEESNRSCAKKEFLTGPESLISPSFKVNSEAVDSNTYSKNNINRNESTKKPNSEELGKFSSGLINNKIVPQNSHGQYEEIQTPLDEEKKKLQSNVEISYKNSCIDLPSKDLLEKSKLNLLWASSSFKSDFLHKIQKSFDNLAKEKEKLEEDVVAKESTLKIMKKREEEYMSLITSLKSSLEKSKEQAEEGAKAIRELSSTVAKLAEQNKISEAIKKKQSEMHGLLERYALENDKLQTQIKILKLESQKHDVLLAGKEAEIKRYKEEIKNFQQQLSDHIEHLKSNSQGLDVEKMMEAIMQQSQIFFQSDLNAGFVAGEQKENSKPNALVHSSPTSTKTSVLNSSWNRISSIHERDKSRQESEFAINFREESNEKEFFQIFGDDSSSCSKSAKTSEAFIDKLSEKNAKHSSSFTSCESLREDSESSVSNGDVDSKKEKTVREPVVSKAAFEKVQSNIDDLLKNLKSKWSKEIFESSGADSTIKDFLNDSQISSITQ